VLWEELQAMLKTVEDSAEVIVVDDGSTDTSVDFVRLLQVTDSRVRLAPGAARSVAQADLVTNRQPRARRRARRPGPR